MSSHYAKGERLGAGGFGYVHRVQRLTDGKVLARKTIIVNNGRTGLADVENECRILSRLRHPHIVQYVDYEHPSTTSQFEAYSGPVKLRFYMEYCPAGSLQDLIKDQVQIGLPLSEDLVWQVTSQLSSALRYCHFGDHTSADEALQYDWQPVLHRDIKPANVLVATRDQFTLVVKLADFGLATIVDFESPPHSYVGTCQYQPPEIARSTGQDIEWTPACDIFSLGCTIHTLCALSPPFVYRRSDEDTYTEIPGDYSQRLKNCVSKCLAHNPHVRPGAHTLLYISGVAYKARILAQKENDSRQPEYRSVSNNSVESEAETSQLVERQDSQGDTWEEMERPVQVNSNQQKEKGGLEQIARSVCAEGYRQYVQGKCQEARDTLQRALCMLESLYGHQDHWDAAECLRVLGLIYRGDRKYEEAERALQKAVSIFEKIHEQQDHSDVVRSLYSLGLTYYEYHEYDEAAKVLRRALSVCERMFDQQNHEHTLHCLTMMGLTYEALNENSEAEALLQRALLMYVKMGKQECEYYRESMYRLGRVHYKQAVYDQAEQVLQKALTMYEKSHGRQADEGIAKCLHLLGRVYHSQEQLIKAEKALERALSLYKSIYGSECEHLEAADCLFCLGLLRYEQNRQDETAEDLLQQALASFEKLHHHECERTVTCMSWLGMVYCEHDKFERAEQLLAQAIVQGKIVYRNRSDCEEIAHCQHKLGVTYHRQRIHDKAEKALEDALCTYDKVHGYWHEDIDTADCLYLLGVTYNQRLLPHKAEKVLRRAQMMFEHLSRSERGREDAADCSCQLGMAYHQQASREKEGTYYQQVMYDKAETELHKALATYDDLYGDGHERRNTAYCLEQLGTVYYKRGEAIDAEQVLQKALLMFEKVHGQPCADIARCRSALGLAQTRVDEPAAMTAPRETPIFGGNIWKHDQAAVKRGQPVCKGANHLGKRSSHSWAASLTPSKAQQMTTRMANPYDQAMQQPKDDKMRSSLAIRIRG